MTKNIQNNDGQQKEKEKIFWDSQINGKYLAYEKKVYAAFREKEYIDIIEKGLTAFKRDKSGKVLDIGCGAGVSTIILANMGFDAIGVDISPNLIKQAQQLACDLNVSWLTSSGKAEGKAEFVVGDGSKLDFADNTFDICFMAGYLHHFPDYNVALKEVRRVLKDGGIMIACEPNRFNLAYRLSFYLVNQKKGVTPNEFPLSPLQVGKDIKKYFKNIAISQIRENDVPFLRQVKWLKDNSAGRAVKATTLFLKNNFTPVFCRGTFFVISAQK
jgi:ubiquinone/menaquinone biosynthesis C-methylase UbiE